jgi:hypothetical protein
MEIPVQLCVQVASQGHRQWEQCLAVPILAAAGPAHFWRIVASQNTGTGRLARKPAFYKPRGRKCTHT